MMSKMFAAAASLVLTAAAAAQTATAPDYGSARITPGSWSYLAVPGGSVARFVDSSGTTAFALECSQVTRRVTIARTAASAAPGLYLWASDASRSLGARFDPAARRVAVELNARDPLLDAMAFSRGRIAVVVAGAETLVMPAWPEAARTIEDCRI